MCGIVGAIAQRDVAPILLEGLKRLEYRGYDSAGIAVINNKGVLKRNRSVGNVAKLELSMGTDSFSGGVGIAHTRWATHGKPTVNNAHPHAYEDSVAIVHNGIIENHELLRETQKSNGYSFSSDTDTEVIVNQIHQSLSENNTLLNSVTSTLSMLKGAYALAVMGRDEPDRLIVARRGSPIVIGLGVRENFVASDVHALLAVTQRFIFLEDGDVAEVTRDDIVVYDETGSKVERSEKIVPISADASGKAGYKHFMQKEIFEQATAVSETLEGRIVDGNIAEGGFEPGVLAAISTARSISIVACGTSYHAGLLAKFWFEEYAGVRCSVEVASEFRYRQPVVSEQELFIAISQSGETADTLAAIRYAKDLGYHSTLAICNVVESSLVREASHSIVTRAGPEIGVASTKAFTTQLAVLMIIAAILTENKPKGKASVAELVSQLAHLPAMINEVLELEESIYACASELADATHALYIGRGVMYPIAMEGALKLKEISYIHAEAYPAGELKHGPLALVDEKMPVIALAPSGQLVEKLKSNLEEISARGGMIFSLTDNLAGLRAQHRPHEIVFNSGAGFLTPIVYNVALQLLAYHVAVLKGSDVDQPRNLAKSVTVE
ncbi:MAG: glutamine--fructose-6-phosphate transaminase (isomerizing) [Proteobacteria bacterium]|nr:glutamine--fructose-6-phosphate transaminase (isomerizing) [Pseudomonadota bacterium]MBT6193232.1 glutamine--fructose-6-phosphate transaminase (isomerizing) [Pseudomonadota bacterium]MBT6465179.1 glutamine--fructose-6-phosphate transaminase (isomerizing) [Pseudomonadota bacterium]MBT6673932.1 glutamine--fructose-6-phosphate transaminase (isomerizing) [Pseudomonadota bacterium]MBT7245575.1 glutamine--fructose-6-phosphate transaminase (isomerizing) [Pseudomonadota bacterium]